MSLLLAPYVAILLASPNSPLHSMQSLPWNLRCWGLPARLCFRSGRRSSGSDARLPPLSPSRLRLDWPTPHFSLGQTLTIDLATLRSRLAGFTISPPQHGVINTFDAPHALPTSAAHFALHLPG